MLEKTIASLLEDANIKWKVTTPEGIELEVQPNEEDVIKMLEGIIARLKDQKTGDQMGVGGLILEKREGFYDVYSYVGSYV